MKSKFRMELPERGPDEPDATERQLGFIRHLLEEIEAEGFSLDIESLGKWQASSLINRLLEIKDGVESDRVIVQDTVCESESVDSGYGSLFKMIILLIIILLIILLFTLVAW